jgi:hypothetical protein
VLRHIVQPVSEYYSPIFFLNQLSMSKFPQRPGCTTLKPLLSEHLYRKISLDQVWGYISNFQMSEKFKV